MPVIVRYITKTTERQYISLSNINFICHFIRGVCLKAITRNMILTLVIQFFSNVFNINTNHKTKFDMLLKRVIYNISVHAACVDRKQFISAIRNIIQILQQIISVFPIFIEIITVSNGKFL